MFTLIFILIIKIEKFDSYMAIILGIIVFWIIEIVGGIIHG